MNVERKRLPFVLATGMTVPLLTLLLLALSLPALAAPENTKTHRGQRDLACRVQRLPRGLSARAAPGSRLAPAHGIARSLLWRGRFRRPQRRD